MVRLVYFSCPGDYFYGQATEGFPEDYKVKRIHAFYAVWYRHRYSHRRACL